MIASECVQIFEQMPCGVIVIDLQGQIEIANPLADRLLGIDQQTRASMTFDALLAKGRRIGGPATFSAIPQDQTSVFKLQIDDRSLQLTCQSGRIGRKAAREVIVITVEDITQTELKLLEGKNHERYSVLGELSADIAHEFRNPLGSIELLASLLRKELKRDKDINRADQILIAVRNMENKISSLIQFSKTYQTPVRWVNLHDILKEILHLSDQNAKNDLPFISVHFDDCNAIVECNRDMMKQVFLTLILNTLQSLSGSSRLDIETHHLPERQLIEVHFIERTMKARAAAPHQITDRFAHAKESHWGLGLALIHNIINMYGGSMRLEYRQDIGSAIVLSFPLTDGKTLSEPIASQIGQET